MSALEREQLDRDEETDSCRSGSLTGVEVAVLWSLRIYLVFMVVVVVYKIWFAAALSPLRGVQVSRTVV